MRKFILKQNADSPKSLNHKGVFDDSTDMIFHLEELKNKWNTSEYGEVDFDLMEIVEGTEMAASAWFNGKDWMRNKDGKVVGFLNFEEKKEFTDGLGETTGEMGTTFIGVTEDNSLFKDIMMRPKIKDVLAAMDYRGVFDINCIKTKEGMVALEPTCRFGIPATSYEFMEGLKSNTGKLIADVAAGKSTPVEIHLGVGMVMVIAAKPFPLEGEFESNQTSLGEKLWILDNGKPIKEFTDEQRKHIWLENFEKKDGDYRVATKSGYLLTVTGKGGSIKEVREKLIEYIKDNLYISGFKYRNDIGKRVEKAGGTTAEQKLQKKHEDAIAELTKKHEEELGYIKEALKKAIYED